MALSRVLQSSWSARILKTGLTVLVVVAAVVAAVPWLLRTGLEKIASEQLGRRLTVEAIDFSPASLQFTLRGLSLFDARGEAWQWQIGRLDLDLAWASLPQRAVVLEALRIQGVRGQLTHLGQGRTDMDDLLLRRSDPTASQPGASGGVPRFALHQLTLQDVVVDVMDLAHGSRHRVDDLVLRVPFLSNIEAWRDAVVEPQLTLALNGARVSVTAQATPFAPTRKTAVQLRLEGLDVQPYLPYWPDMPGWRPQAGRLAADIQLDFEQQTDPRLRLSGRVMADAVRWLGAHGEPWAAESVQLAWADAQPWGGQVSAPVSFQLQGQIGQTGTALGTLDIQGRLAMAPLVVRGQIAAERLPLHAVSAYLGHVLNARVRHAAARVRGEFTYRSQPDGAMLQFAGDAGLDDVQVSAVAGMTETGGQRLLSWKGLDLRGVDLALAPGQPSRIAVAASELRDFYARVILSPEGRLNLQDLLKTAQADPVAAPPPQIRLGPITLHNGRVQFTDRFIQPSYSAQLSGLTGRLGGFSSDAPQDMAELSLTGRAEGTAQLEIRGRLNPLARPLTLAIQGRVRDLELPPLSPYAIKYAGHGIARGKLAMDVSYQVQPDGQLEANNRLVLQQLTFGDAVPGAPTSLPVRLAVALLADRDGVIDVDLPIRGSLNDPEFSLGPVIFKAVKNLLTKAVTAPFNFLASLFGGGDEQGVVPFAPGSAMLQAERLPALDKMAEAMQQRPALILTLTGSASLALEQDAFVQLRLQTQPKATSPVGEAQMRQLAQARSTVVRDHLLARGVSADRLFLGAPRLVDAPAPDWTPQVDMLLAAP